MDYQTHYEGWRKITLWANGVFGPVATDLGLDLVDCTILRWISFLSKRKRAKYVTFGNKRYVWMSYPHFIERYPMVGIDTPKSIGRIVSRLCQKKILERQIVSENGTNRSYFRIISPYPQFLFPELDDVSASERLCKEWCRFLDFMAEKGDPVELRQRIHKSEVTAVSSGKIVSMVSDNFDLFGKELSTTTKVIVDPKAPLSGEFVEYIENIDELPEPLKHSVYDKDGKVTKTGRILDDMFHALLDGTFCEKYKPKSKKYNNFEGLGKVTLEEIWRSTKSYSEFSPNLYTKFKQPQKHTSDLLEFIMRQRLKKAVVQDIPTDDNNFNTFLQFSKIKWTPELKSAAYDMHLWLMNNAKDLQEMNKGGGQNLLFSGLGEMGSYLDNHLRKLPNWELNPSNFKQDSQFWKGFARYIYKARNAKILSDDSVYRRINEDAGKREELYEYRSRDLGISLDRKSTAPLDFDAE